MSSILVGEPAFLKLSDRTNLRYHKFGVVPHLFSCTRYGRRSSTSVPSCRVSQRSSPSTPSICRGSASRRSTRLHPTTSHICARLLQASWTR